MWTDTVPQILVGMPRRRIRRPRCTQAKATTVTRNYGSSPFFTRLRQRLTSAAEGKRWLGESYKASTPRKHPPAAIGREKADPHSGIRFPALDHTREAIGCVFDELGVSALRCLHHQVDQTIDAVTSCWACSVMETCGRIEESLESPISAIEDQGLASGRCRR